MKAKFKQFILTCAITATTVVLVGCGIKDPSFYDLKSPCVANEYLQHPYLDTNDNPCIKSTPGLNQYFDGQVRAM